MTTDTEGEDIRVSCEVVNSGCRDGAEVVQLYVKTPENNTFHPVRELRAFEKIRLKAGERRRVEFTVKKSDLKYYDTVLKIGQSSRAITNSRFAGIATASYFPVG